MSERPLVCIPEAIPAAQWARYEEIRQYVTRQSESLGALTNGYALRFPPDGDTLLRLAEFITLERLCCPFLDFALLVNEDSALLHMTGGEGTTEFLKQEMGFP